MNYAEQTIESKFFIKRFSHAKRFDTSLNLLDVKNTDTIIDYGTGDGFMIKKLISKNPSMVVGYEPMEDQYNQLKLAFGSQRINNVKITNNLNLVESMQFDKACILEVLEHLTERNQLDILNKIRQVMNKDGIILISVPIEIGFSGLLKNLIRIIINQKHKNTNFKNILKSFFGLKIDRGQDDYITTHIGFNYHDLEKIIISSGYKITKKEFSPIKIFGGFLNSQVFFVLALQDNQE